MAKYEFPVAIGDIVTAVVEDDEHIVDIIHYEVCGVAQKGDKQYVIDKYGDLYEIGSELCLLGEHERKVP